MDQVLPGILKSRAVGGARGPWVHGRYRTTFAQFRPASGAVSSTSISCVLVGPPVVYSHGASQRASYHNFAPDQFLTQAERDLIERVRQHLRENRMVAAYANDIKLAAEEGRVSLSGTVKSDQAKEEIAATARRTRGVTAVENDLQVTGSVTTRKRG